jgi:prolyl oligopeptidase
VRGRVASGVLAVFAVMSVAVASAKAPAPPVPTRKENVVDHLHGVDVADPYRWLEDAASPEVQRWTEAENALTRRTLDAYPGREALAARLWQLHEIGSLGTPVPRGHGKQRRYFYTRRDGKQNQPVLYVRDGVDGVDRALVDVNALAADGTRALDWWHPSEDGALVAYGVSADGNEESVLRVRDVASGRDLPDAIPGARACSVAWAPDSRSFYYTRYPAPGSVPPSEEKYHRWVFFHRLGDDPAHDAKVFGEGRDRTDWPSVALSPDGRWLVITVSQGWSKSEVYLFDRRSPATATTPITVAAGEEAEFEVAEILDDRLYLLTTSGAPRRQLYAVELAHPERARWHLVIPEGADILDGVAYFGGRLAATYVHDAASRLRLFSAAGEPRGELPLPALGTVGGLGAARDADELFYAFTSFLTPTAVFRHHGDAAGAAPDAVWRRLASPIDPAAFEVERVQFTSRDGTHCPMFLVHKKGLPRDGARPAVLTGYGGFNISMQPGWTPSAAPFLERGGVYALAVLRGGGEYGESWHQAGMLGRKQNVFDDFIGAAEWLIANKVTSPARLAITGRSNGGLLVGAALTQRPDLYRAVVCGVPLLDMLRYDRFRIAQLWIPEYGAPADPQAFKWLYAYSPYHHVKDGAAYPAVLIHTAESDTRVDAMHARKMTARLQAATGSGQPVLLRLESKAGHGAGKPLGKVIDQLTDEWSFLFSQLGMGS